MRLLLVEDEPAIASAVAEVLRDETYAVDVANDGRAADELMATNDYDLVILDWGIPAPSGIELLRRWRGAGRTTPVLMLTARSTVGDRIDGLDGGADDYLTKPFSLDEVLARVRSLLRRSTRSPDLAALTADDLEMDRAAHTVRIAGRDIELSPKEFAVLEHFLLHKDRVVSRTEISDHVWDDSFDSMSNVVDVTVHRLRRKIDGAQPGRLLHTVKGAGYILKSHRS
ncbi:MAG: response regulator transcription factor [Acidobacteriota bacterium]